MAIVTLLAIETDMAIMTVLAIETVSHLSGIKPGINCKDSFQGSLQGTVYVSLINVEVPRLSLVF